MKKIFLFLILSIAFNTYAENVELARAKKVAENAFAERYYNLTKEVKSFKIESVYHETFNNEVSFYAFNIEGGGFILISADDIATPVLGFNYEGKYASENQAENFKFWLNGYKKDIDNAKKAKVKVDYRVSELWNTYENLDLNKLSSKRGIVVPNLTRSVWNQDYPYNALCPADAAGPGGHVYAGCVATTMAQIMYYWGYPNTGSGSHTHSSSYGNLFVNFGTTTYDWAAMKNEATALNNEIAKLQYHCGVAVDMGYAPDGSGAYSTDVPYALQTYFKYNSASTVTTPTDTKLKTEFDNKRPVYFAATNSELGGGGHAFVCSGYSTGTANEYYFNWGWSGSGNGYYALNVMASGNGTYTLNQRIITGITPKTAYPEYCTNTKSLSLLTGRFDDGSGNAYDYQNSKNCYWWIAPNNPTGTDRIELEFEEFKVASDDTLYVYRRKNNADSLLGKYTGTTLPTKITSYSDSVLVNFVTNASNVSNGWRINYNVFQLTHCSGTKTFTINKDTILDGSNNLHYANNVNCRWKITPTGATRIVLKFTDLKLENDKDFVKIYNSVSTASTYLIGTFTGTTIPTDSVVSTTGKMTVVLTSDAENTNQGFSAYYTSDGTYTDIKSIDNSINEINLYPNPASDFVNIEFYSSISQDLQIDITNTLGQNIFSEKESNFLGRYERKIPTSTIKNGVYVITIKGQFGIHTEKLVVE